jgi:hypothetical protein
VYGDRKQYFSFMDRWRHLDWYIGGATKRLLFMRSHCKLQMGESIRDLLTFHDQVSPAARYRNEVIQPRYDSDTLVDPQMLRGRIRNYVLDVSLSASNHSRPVRCVRRVSRGLVRCLFCASLDREPSMDYKYVSINMLDSVFGSNLQDVTT